MDEIAFERTLDEIKYRYYEVAKALLKHREDFTHPYLNYEYDIEHEIQRKNNWEKVIGRGKEQFEKENQILQEHLKIESQIRKVEEEEQKKLKLIGQLVNIKIPCVIPCQLIDPKKPIDDYHRERNKEGAGSDKVPNLYDKVGLNRNLKNAGVYFISNEIAQEPPLPDDLKLKAKMWKEGLQIDVNSLTPSTKVA